MPSFSSLVIFHYLLFILKDLKGIEILVVLRPNLSEFLQIANQYYNLYLYTNARNEYTKMILSFIDTDSKKIKNNFFLTF